MAKGKIHIQSQRSENSERERDFKSQTYTQKQGFSQGQRHNKVRGGRFHERS